MNSSSSIYIEPLEMITPTSSFIYDDTIDTSNIHSVLLIDSNVSMFQTYANSTSFPIIYDRYCQQEDLIALLARKFTNISAIVFIFHYMDYPYFLNNNLLFTYADLNSNVVYSSNTQFVINLIKQFQVPNIDFLACNTLLYPEWNKYYSLLNVMTGVVIGASNNNTGNIKYMGDWIMESTGEDVQNMYFNNRLLNYSSLLATYTLNYVSYSYESVTNTASVIGTVSPPASWACIIPSTILISGTTYTVTSIANNAFNSLGTILSCSIPNTVTTIGSNVFFNCNNLTTCNLPTSLISIGTLMFYQCYNLTSSMTIPIGCTTIGDGIFVSCWLIPSITVLSPITYIPSNFCNKCYLIPSFTIPSTVTSIGASAFSYCYGIKNITIPSSVTTIGGQAFSPCSLTSIVFPSSVTSIGANIFSYNSQIALSQFSILSSGLTTTIANQAFYGAYCNFYGLPSTAASLAVMLANNFTVNQLALIGFALVDIWAAQGVIPTADGLYISNNIVQACSIYTTSVNIPTGVTAIAPYAFAGWYSLVNGPTSYCNCTLLQNVTIPSTVTSIGIGSFFNCTSLTTINIPSSVTSIGNYAFWTCSSLPTITIPSSVISIGTYAFQSCINLATANINASITTISDYVFSGCTKLTSVTIPRTVTTINQYAFQNCNNLSNITIPTSVTSIGQYAFQNCGNISMLNATIQATNLTIAATVFSGSGLNTFTFPNSGTNIVLSNCFNSSYTPKISGLATTIVSLSNMLSNGFTSSQLTSGGFTIADIAGAQLVKSGANIQTAPVYATYNYISTTSAVINWPAAIQVTNSPSTSITGYTIISSSSINAAASTTVAAGITTTTLTGLSANTTYIFTVSANNSICQGYQVTAVMQQSPPSSCTYIYNSTTSATVSWVQPSIITGAISGYTVIYTPGNISTTVSASTKSLTITGLTAATTYTFTVTANNSIIGSSIAATAILNQSNNCITYTYTSSATITGYTFAPPGWNLTLPSSIINNGTAYPVTIIAANAFLNCTNLTSIIIPSSITTINASAFQGCLNLTSVTIPSTCNSIGASAFQGCSALTSITIPSGVTTLPSNVFYGCNSLASVTIPIACINFNTSMFSYLSTITILGSGRSLGTGTFSGISGYGSSAIIASLTAMLAQGFTTTQFITAGFSLTDIWTAANVTPTSNGLYISSNVVQAWKYTNTNSIVIPNTCTSIAANVFNGCTSITSITLPSALTASGIGANAFQGCTALTSIIIPSSCTSIPAYAFAGCTYLASITMNASTFIAAGIGANAFQGCSALTSITIPSGNTSIPAYAFQGCIALTTITIPATVTSIAANAFQGCANLVLTIPATITSIGSYAFHGCTCLTTITLASGHTTIPSYAFYGCTGLTSITIPSSVTTISDYAFYGCTSLTLTVAATVTTLATYAFSGCLHFNITLPSSITSIPNYAFYGCIGLTSITIPNTCTSIGTYAFYGCTGLTSITIPSGNTSIPTYAFYGCTSLTSITIPSTVTTIQTYAFSGCSSLTGFTMSNATNGTIYNYAFQGCTALATIIIPSPDSVTTSIYPNAFLGAGTVGSTSTINMLKSFLLLCNNPVGQALGFAQNLYMTWGFNGNDVWNAYNQLYISNPSFIGNQYTTSNIEFIHTSDEYYINSSVTAGNGGDTFTLEYWNYTTTGNLTPAGSFYNATNNYVFQNCQNLNSIILPASLINLSQGMFQGCTNLTSVIMPTFPRNTSGIPTYAFYGCSGLTSIHISPTITAINDYAFYGCSSLANITWSAVLNSIGNYSFYGCSSLTSVVFPPNVTTINSYSFYGCSSLTSVTYQSTPSQIYPYTFYGCTGLTTFTIPPSVTNIATYAFYGCTNLTNIVIPASVVTFGQYIFPSTLTTFTILGSGRSLGTGTFSNMPNLVGTTSTINTLANMLITGFTTSQLILAGFALSDIGNAVLSVNSVVIQTPPTNVIYTSTNSTTVVISWNAATPVSNTPSTGSIVNYLITYNPGNVSTIIAANLTTATFTNLTEGVTYTFTISASNNVGYSVPTIASLRQIPPSYATYEYIDASHNTAYIEWPVTLPIVNTPSTGAITNYTVVYNPGNVSSVVSASSTSTTISGLTSGVTYTFTVAASNIVGLSIPVTAYLKQTPPSYAVYEYIDASSVLIQWLAATAVSNSPSTGSIADYIITYTPGNVSTTVSASTTSTTITGLTHDVAYTFTIAASNNIGYSDAAYIYLKQTPPQNPTYEYISGTSAKIEWLAATAVSNTPSSGAISGYIINYTPGNVSTTVSASTTSTTITGLTSGVSYTFTIAANNSIGSSGFISTYLKQTPPSNVTYEYIDASSAKIEWHAADAVSNTPSTGNVLSYTIYYTYGVSNPILSTIVYSGTTAIITGLVFNNTTYTFSVSANNIIGASDLVQALVKQTPPPYATYEYITSTSAIIEWGPATPVYNSPSTGNIIDYTITYNPGNISIDVSYNELSTIITGLTSGINYVFLVSDSNNMGPSDSIIAALKQTPPTNVTYEYIDSSSVQIEWVAASPVTNTPSTGAITHYIITYNPGNVSTTISAASGTSAIIHGLDSTVSYTFNIKASNNIGPSDLVVARLKQTPPTNMIYTYIDSSSVFIEWSPATPVSNSPSTGNITGYTITYNPGNVSTSISASTLNTTITGLNAEVQYVFTIAASNSIGSSSNAIVPLQQTPPTNITYEYIDSSSALIGWTAATPVSNSPSTGNITGYTITYNPGNVSTTVDASATNVTIVGLNLSTIYTYTICASNNIGLSRPSIPVTTPQAPVNTLYITHGVTTIVEGQYPQMNPVAGVYYTSIIFDSTSNIAKIDNNAFNGWSHLVSIYFDPAITTLTTIGDPTFGDCTSLTSFTIPSTVSQIDAGAFLNCSALTTVIFETDANGNSALTSISANLFEGCSSLSSLTIPNSVTTIEAGALIGCASLTSITCNNNIVAQLVAIDAPILALIVGGTSVQTILTETSLVLIDLIPLGVTETQIKLSGITDTTIIAALQQTIIDSVSFNTIVTNYSLSIILSAITNLTTLKTTIPNLIYGITQLLINNVTIAQLLTTGITADQILAALQSMIQDINTTPIPNLITIVTQARISAKFTWQKLLFIGVTHQQLMDAEFFIIPTPCNLTLSAMESNVTLGALATMPSDPLIQIDASAVAVLHVPINIIHDTFQFRSSDAKIYDVSGSHIHYYLFDSSFIELNPANATLDDPASSGAIATTNSNGDSYPSSTMQIKHDFIRYLAVNLFSTHYGVDLFSNVDDIKNNITTICGNSMPGYTWYNITSMLHNVSVTGTDESLEMDANNLKYMTNANTTSSNICRELLLQLSYADIFRFSNILNTDLPQPIPLIVGDSINFKLTINPAVGQEELTGVEPFGYRSYQIKIIIDPVSE